MLLLMLLLTLFLIRCCYCQGINSIHASRMFIGTLLEQAIASILRDGLGYCERQEKCCSSFAMLLFRRRSRQFRPASEVIFM
jgi:hypothetical protein